MGTHDLGNQLVGPGMHNGSGRYNGDGILGADPKEL